MKVFFILIRIILALTVITLGVNRLSEPSNSAVFFGAVLIVLGLAILGKLIALIFQKQ